MTPPDPDDGPTIHIAKNSDIGLRRLSMQDVSVAEKLQGGEFALIAVADGIGGGPAGDVASSLAARALVDSLATAALEATDDWANALSAAAHAANDAVVQAAADRPEYAGMATTLTAVLINNTRAAIAHIGDSRAYLLRNGALQLLTRDHTQAQETFGRTAPDLPGRHVLTRVIGGRPNVQPDTTTIDLRSGDRLLVASDGLHGVVEPSHITELLAASNLKEALALLIEAALAAGGPDNIAVAGAYINAATSSDATSS